MIRIPLTKGFVAIVDESDADLAALRWQATIVPRYGDAYATRSVMVGGRKHTLYLHRVIAERMGADISSGETDHRDGDKLNCRRRNIRHGSGRANRMNIAAPPARNTSGLLGVSFHRRSGKWMAQMRRPGRSSYLGLFGSPEAAYAARLAAEREDGIQPRRAGEHT